MNAKMELKQILAENDIKYDPWGTVLGAHFAICDEMLYMGYTIPHSWGFRPGACHTPERDYDGGWAYYFENQPEKKLIRWGNVLSRYSAKLKAAGKDY